MALRSRITGVGSYVPPKVVTNEDLSRLFDTSDEWITQRTGIKQRHWVEGSTSTSDLALEASRQALASAGVGPEDLDMIFFATISPDHFFPGSGVFLQRKLGISDIPAIDVRQQCTGFIYGTSMADQYIRTGSARRVLVVGAEIHSKGLDLSSEGRDVTVLFGDGAGAIVMEATDVQDPAVDPHVFSTHLHADGTFAEELWVEAPGMAVGDRMVTYEIIDRGQIYPKMNGRKVYVNAIKRMPEAITETIEANGVALEDVDLFVFHQANLRINEAVAQRMGIPEEKVFNTIDRFANTTAATIPIGLHEAEKAEVLQPGMLVASASFGSGFTWASMLIRW
ncbi:MAG: beta-ketoacyl-ACP synthase III [Gammaproteobacteria bacterium]|nr:beta-ketoacyl-ACP synthase III [Gammaproteobacteria bacterium]